MVQWVGFRSAFQKQFDYIWSTFLHGYVQQRCIIFWPDNAVEIRSSLKFGLNGLDCSIAELGGAYLLSFDYRCKRFHEGICLGDLFRRQLSFQLFDQLFRALVASLER